MPKSKDVSEKILEDHNDVFTDIVNGLVFNMDATVTNDDIKDKVVINYSDKITIIEYSAWRFWDWRTSLLLKRKFLCVLSAMTEPPTKIR